MGFFSSLKSIIQENYAQDAEKKLKASIESIANITDFNGLYEEVNSMIEELREICPQEIYKDAVLANLTAEFIYYRYLYTELEQSLANNHFKGIDDLEEVYDVLNRQSHTKEVAEKEMDTMYALLYKEYYSSDEFTRILESEYKLICFSNEIIKCFIMLLSSSPELRAIFIKCNTEFITSKVSFIIERVAKSFLVHKDVNFSINEWNKI